MVSSTRTLMILSALPLSLVIIVAVIVAVIMAVIDDAVNFELLFSLTQRESGVPSRDIDGDWV
jgi:hypothetical protein